MLHVIWISAASWDFCTKIQIYLVVGRLSVPRSFDSSWTSIKIRTSDINRHWVFSKSIAYRWVMLATCLDTHTRLHTFSEIQCRSIFDFRGSSSKTSVSVCHEARSKEGVAVVLLCSNVWVLSHGRRAGYRMHFHRGKTTSSIPWTAQSSWNPSINIIQSVLINLRDWHPFLVVCGIPSIAWGKYNQQFLRRERKTESSLICYCCPLCARLSPRSNIKPFLYRLPLSAYACIAPVVNLPSILPALCLQIIYITNVSPSSEP